MKTIGLLSGKGGVGKTTSALNLAAALNSFGQDVIVLDGNLTTPNLALHLGIAQPETSIHHVLKGQKKIHEAIHTHNSGLKFIPGSLSLSDMQNLRLQRFKSIKNLSSDYLNIRLLEPGMYFVKLTVDGKISTSKLIIK